MGETLGFPLREVIKYETTLKASGSTFVIWIAQYQLLLKYSHSKMKCACKGRILTDIAGTSHKLDSIDNFTVKKQRKQFPGK